MVLLAGLLVAQADAPPSAYKIDQVVTVGRRQLRSTVYVDQGQVRAEARPDAKNLVVTLMAVGQDTLYNILVQPKIVQQLPLDLNNRLLLAPYDASLPRIPLGTESIDGQQCSKYALTIEKNQILLWLERDSRLPVRLQTIRPGLLVQWFNPQPGPQPAALFKPPTDYKWN